MIKPWILGLMVSFGGLTLADPPSALAASFPSETPGSADTIAQATVPDIWQEASAAEIEQIWRFVLHSPLGIAALNQLAIEGFISPTCEKTWYKHTEYDTFQTLLQVDCGQPQGVSGARAYDEMRVTFNRFEDTIEGFEVERIYVEDEMSALPYAVVEAVLAAAAQQSEADPNSLYVAEAVERTWQDGCLGLGGPAESCILTTVPGWRVVVSDGEQNWVFRTDAEGQQVRFNPTGEG